jgi:fatty-acyl-CoA synthase
MSDPLTIGGLFERRVLDPRYAERPFLLFEDRTYTWLETWESSVTYANSFRHWCLIPGAFWLDEEIERLQTANGEAFSRKPEVEVAAEDPWAIIFTSGSTAAPKAILNSHYKVMSASAEPAGPVALADSDVFYAALPLFHSNALGLALMPALVHGGTLAIARRFSARGFLPDVRRHGVTIFSFVGKPFAYILATDEGPDDADNPLRAAVGAGATRRQQEEFGRRFGVNQVVELFGSTEAGASTVRRPGDPSGTVGAMPPHVRVVDAEDQECEPACLDEHGALLNYEEAVGEIVNVEGPGLFEGYYKNPKATAAKMRGGKFRTGDLAYYRIIEHDGEPTRFLYYVGRTDDWIRKDGENFVAEPIEEILMRHPDIEVCSVYGVPCAQGDDLVMAALVLRRGREFDSGAFYAFLEDQADLSPKWMPDYVRLASALPQTRTLKILRRDLKQEAFDLERVADPLYWRERGEVCWKRFSREDAARVREEFVRAGR